MCFAGHKTHGYDANAKNDYRETKRVSSRSLVYKWQKRFSDGRSSIKADPLSERSEIINAGLMASLKEIIETDGCVSPAEVVERLGDSYATTHLDRTIRNV